MPKWTALKAQEASTLPKELRKAESRRGDLFQEKNMHTLDCPELNVIPENIHTHNIIWTEHVIFWNMHICM